jgi:hypothetical protein
VNFSGKSDGMGDSERPFAGSQSLGLPSIINPGVRPGCCLA